MTDDSAIECSTHGKATATYVCEHLIADPKQRWCCDYPTADNPWPDAWCAKCDMEYQKEGEWNERNEGHLKIKLLCNQCYESRLASSVEFVDEDIDENWSRTVLECHEEMASKQKLLEMRFSIGKHKRWDYDLEAGTLTFSNDGIPAVIADIEVIGSVSKVSGTWLWSWANFHLPPNVRSRIVAARDFGEHNAFPRLTVPKWRADEVDGWEVSAIAARELYAEGLYRAPTANGFLFMALVKIKFAT